jgi:hypothetical protein
LICCLPHLTIHSRISLPIISHFPSIISHFPSIPSHFLPLSVISLPILCHFPSILAHFPSILAHFPSILAHFPSILAHFPSILAHFPSTLAHFLSLLTGPWPGPAGRGPSRSRLSSRPPAPPVHHDHVCRHAPQRHLPHLPAPPLGTRRGREADQCSGRCAGRYVKPSSRS